MTLLHPIWLLLLIPLIISLRVWKLPSRLLGRAASGDPDSDPASDVRTGYKIAEPGRHDCRRGGQKSVDAS